MKRGYKPLAGALLALVVVAAPFAADARPFGHGGPGYHYGPGYTGGMAQPLPQEKLELLYKMRADHYTAMQPVMEQLWSKQTLLDALSRNPKVEPKEINDLVNEISALRSKMTQECAGFAAKVKKETGYDMPYDGMMAMHGKTYGKRGGHHYSGGHGRGCAW